MLGVDAAGKLAVEISGADAAGDSIEAVTPPASAIAGGVLVGTGDCSVLAVAVAGLGEGRSLLSSVGR